MIVHLPATVGDTLANVPADADILMVAFREAGTGYWRVGWSKMDIADLCLAKEYVVQCVQRTVADSYREAHSG